MYLYGLKLRKKVEIPDLFINFHIQSGINEKDIFFVD